MLQERATKPCLWEGLHDELLDVTETRVLGVLHELEEERLVGSDKGSRLTQPLE